MCIGSVLREERIRAQLSQGELARMLRVSPSALSAYEREERAIPRDIVMAAVRCLNSPRLGITMCHQCPANIMRWPWLDLVDRHPVVVRDKLIEELREAAEALEAVCLINRRRAEDLTTNDRKALDAAVEQLADVLPAAMMGLAVIAEVYGYDLGAVSRRLNEKLTGRRYASRQAAVAVPA